MSSNASKGVLFINLGSPDSPATADIRRYLREFLSDKRVMTMPALVRWMLVNLFIVPFRPAALKPRYESIWDGNSFPLISHGNELVQRISCDLGDDYEVKLAMRYGNPNLRESLEQFRKAGVAELLVFPLFPQYSSATTGSILEQVMEIIKHWTVFPDLKLVSGFYAHPAFISAWIAQGKALDHLRPDHTLFSFHGLPESHLREADATHRHCLIKENCCREISNANHGCYRAQCFHTAHAIAQGLNLQIDRFSISFQSRLGRGKWLEPYTLEHVKMLAEKGVKRLLVFCPSFVADCLETTEEIQVEVQEAFIKNGGEDLILVPSLNSSDVWITALKTMIRERA